MRRWPEDLEYKRVVLDVEDRSCEVCDGITSICDHRTRHLYTLGGALFLVNKLQHCADKTCEGHHRTMSPEAEMSIAHPGWAIGWDVFAWIGHRRFARHWSVPQIRGELADTYAIRLSSDAIENYVRRYQTMVAARQQDPARLAEDYRGVSSVQLSIDGLQPEKGHETLYVVRELRRRRVWFAEALISSNEAEVRRLIVRAKQMAKRLGKPVSAWVSDKQEAFVKGIAAEFPGVPHRYCQNHFLRDLAKPMLEKDSHAKVQMRRKVRGLRAIEKDVQAARTSKKKAGEGESAKRKASKRKKVTRSKRPTRSEGISTPEAQGGDAEQVVLDYCSAVRGILNNSQGGALHPPGLRMAEGLRAVKRSLGRCVAAQPEAPTRGSLERLAGCIQRGLDQVREEQREVRKELEVVRNVAATLDVENGPCATRRARFNQQRAELEEDPRPFWQRAAVMMGNWAAGLFAGGNRLSDLTDNLDLERWFRMPKSHERHIHGRAHAGVRIVQEGPTLVLALDAHRDHPDVFTEAELLPYKDAQAPPSQREALRRRKIMRQARSRKQRPGLFKRLEQRFLSSS